MPGQARDNKFPSASPPQITMINDSVTMNTYSRLLCPAMRWSIRAHARYPLVHSLDSWCPRPSQPVPGHTAQHNTALATFIHDHNPMTVARAQWPLGAAPCSPLFTSQLSSAPSQLSSAHSWPGMCGTHTSRTHGGPAEASSQTRLPHLPLQPTPPAPPQAHHQTPSSTEAQPTPTTAASSSYSTPLLPLPPLLGGPLQRAEALLHLAPQLHHPAQKYLE